MRNLKKVLGLTLCLAMMLSLMVVGAGAAFIDQSDIDEVHQDAVNMCVSLSIIDGFEDGSFKPTDNVTREQMAKMICVLDNGGKDPQGATGNTFADVPADRWSNKYVEACAARGVVSGVGDNKFDPASDVTPTQAAKMLLVELGYKADIANYEGDQWATYVNIDATKKGYYEDLEDIDTTAPMSREHAAQMIWNALQADEVEYSYTLVTDPVTGEITSKVDVNNVTDFTLLLDKYGAEVKQAYLVNTSYNSTKEEYTYSFENSAFNGDTIAAKDYFDDGSIKSDQDFSDLFGMKVKVVSKDDKLFGITAFESEVLTSGIVSDLPDKISGTSVKIDDTSYDLNKAATPVYGFNLYEELGALASYKTSDTGYFAFDLIDNNDDGKANVMVVYPVTVGKITFANSSEIRVGTDKYTYEDDTIYDGAEKNDWAVITAAENTVDGKNVVEKLTPVTGTVSAKDKESFRIGSDWFDKAGSFDGEVPNNKDEVEVIAYNGYYFDVDGVSTALDVAVVTGIGNWDNMESTLAVKLMMKDGSQTTVNVEKWNGLSDDELQSAKFDKNVMVAFDEDDGNYTLVTVTNGTDNVKAKESAKTDYDGVVISADKVEYNKDKAAVITPNDVYDIAADAFVVIYDGDDYTYMTGADLLTKNGFNFGFSYGDKQIPISFYAAVDGNEVGALFGYVGDSITSGDELYAYIISADTQVNASDKEKVYVDVVIDGKKIEDVETNKDAKDLGKYVAGTVVQYTMDGEVMNIGDTMTMTNAAIKDFDGTTVVRFYKDSDISKVDRVVIDSDAVIIAYDSDDDYAYVGDTLYEAPACAVGQDGKASEYYKNAWYHLNKDGDIDVIFVDIFAPDVQ